MRRTPLLPCHRRAEREGGGRKTRPVLFRSLLFLSTRPSYFARGRVDNFASPPQEKEDFLISIRIAGGPIINNQFNDIWQVGTERTKHQEEKTSSKFQPSVFKWDKSLLFSRNFRPSVSKSSNLPSLFSPLPLSLSLSLSNTCETPPTSPLTSLLWHLLVCMKNHSGRRRAAPQQDSLASISISSTASAASVDCD